MRKTFNKSEHIIQAVQAISMQSVPKPIARTVRDDNTYDGKNICIEK